jgi:hypothetical protein
VQRREAAPGFEPGYRALQAHRCGDKVPGQSPFLAPWGAPRRVWGAVYRHRTVLSGQEALRQRSSVSRRLRAGSGRSETLGRWHVHGLYLVKLLDHQAEATMAQAETYKVSSSGQMSLPAAARHRWHLDDGGRVDVLDLGFGVLTVPAGYAGRLLDDILPADAHYAAVAAEDDPDLVSD